MRLRYSIRHLLATSAVVAAILALTAPLFRGRLVKECESGEVILGKTPYGVIRGDMKPAALRRILLSQLNSLDIKDAFSEQDITIVPMDIGGERLYRIEYPRYCVKRLNPLTFQFELDYGDVRARRINDAMRRAIEIAQTKVHADG